MALKKFLDRIAGEPNTIHYKSSLYDDLLSAESELGRTLFGPIPAGHQREFFKHRGNVWIWHENWLDGAGVEQEITIRYEVRPNGVYKKVPGAPYERLVGGELANFRLATRSYFDLVGSKLYR